MQTNELMWLIVNRPAHVKNLFLRPSERELFIEIQKLVLTMPEGEQYITSHTLADSLEREQCNVCVSLSRLHKKGYLKRLTDYSVVNGRPAYRYTIAI